MQPIAEIPGEVPQCTDAGFYDTLGAITKLEFLQLLSLKSQIIHLPLLSPRARRPPRSQLSSDAASRLAAAACEKSAFRGSAAETPNCAGFSAPD